MVVLRLATDSAHPRLLTTTPAAVGCSALLARASGPNTQARLIEYPQPPLNVFGRQQAAQGHRNLSDAWQCLLAQSNHDDSGCCARRMLNHVGEAAIERYQYALFACRRRQHLVVGNTSQLLVASERHVVAGLPENRPNRVRNILIELDRRHDYAAGIGTIVSRASSAAYANAAGIASFGSVG